MYTLGGGEGATILDNYEIIRWYFKIQCSTFWFHNTFGRTINKFIPKFNHQLGWKGTFEIAKLHSLQKKPRSISIGDPEPITEKRIPSWWFQPIWKILVKIMGIFPK